MEYGRKFLYGMVCGMEDFWYGMEMEWKKIASMEYGKIVFHSIPYHALPVTPKILVITPEFVSKNCFFCLQVAEASSQKSWKFTYISPSLDHIYPPTQEAATVAPLICSNPQPLPFRG